MGLKSLDKNNPDMTWTTEAQNNQISFLEICSIHGGYV
jgi:hypothetical protein